MAQNPNPVTIRHYSWDALVKERWGDEYYKPDVAYTFSNDRKFDDSGPNSGIYAPTHG